MAQYKSRFSQGRTGGVGTTGVTSTEIINAGTKEAFIKKITCNLTAATATLIGVGRPAAAGVTPTAPVALLADNGVDTTLVKTAIAWATPPTIPAVFLRQGSAPAAIGNVIEFVFDGQGLRLAPNQTLVIWNLGTNSILNVTVVAEQNVIAVV